MSGERTCSNCGASMHQTQDWCLNCGSGAPRGAHTGPGWRSAAIALGATGALVLGAAAAAYAALQQRSPAKPRPVAQTTTTTTTSAPTTTAQPPDTTPTTTPPPSVTTPETTPSIPSRLLKTSSTPPKIPATTPTPRSGQKKHQGKDSTTKTTTTTTTDTSTTPGEEEGEKSGSQPVAVLLDTDAAQTYNPSKLAASRFGDPSLAVDGDATTAWTVQLEPSEAPNVGAGLSLDLNTSLKIAQLTLIAETVGMTVQVYGTTASKLPEALTSEEWVRLSHPHLVKKRKATIDLSEDTKRFRQLLIWISKAPTSSTGQFTGSDVAINEVQLFEPKQGQSQGQSQS